MFSLQNGSTHEFINKHRIIVITITIIIIFFKYMRYDLFLAVELCECKHQLSCRFPNHTVLVGAFSHQVMLRTLVATTLAYFLYLL